MDITNRKIEITFVAVAATAISLLWYGPFLETFFVLDSFYFLEFNSVGGLKEQLFGYGNLRVVTPLLWKYLYKIAGNNPAWYSSISLLFHIANAFLLYIVIMQLLQNRFVAILSSIFFVSYAAGCDAVLWKAALSSVAVLFFYLLVLYFYLLWRHRAKKKYMGFVFLFFLLGILTKEIIASAPFMILLIEFIFFRGTKKAGELFKLLVPFFFIILAYIALSLFFTFFLDIKQGNFVGLGNYNPLHSFFAGFTVFFLSPKGILANDYGPLYAFILFVPLSFFVVNNKKVLCFGYLWVFISFLPQSLASITSFESPYLANSVSRQLYSTAVGPALVYALFLDGIRKKLPFKIFILFLSVFILGSLYINYKRVEDRGGEWGYYGFHNKRFISALKDVMPTMEDKTYFFVFDRPAGRAFIQSALRAFYKNPEIYWVDDPNKKIDELKEGDQLYVIHYNRDKKPPVEIYRGR